MRLFGRALSILARLILRGAWRQLGRDLELTYARYCATVRSQIPPIVIATLIVAEDHRFYTHGGVDPIAIGRALWHRATGRKLNGASTIEQQLVRTLTGRYERSVRRKVREIMLATLVHCRIPKSEITGLYLSLAYFGWRMNGIQQACRRLQIELSSATARQAASIVARLKYPEPKEPSPRRARQIAVRTDYVLRVMARRYGAQYPAEVTVPARGQVTPARVIVDRRPLEHFGVAEATTSQWALYDRVLSTPGCGPYADKLTLLLHAIARRETGGRYDAVGEIGVPRQGRALGKYQFMLDTLFSLGYGKYLGSENPADYQDPLKARELASAFLNNPQLQDTAAIAYLGVLAETLGVDWDTLTETDVARLAAAWVGGAHLAKSPERWDRANVGPGTQATVRDYSNAIVDHVRRAGGSAHGITPDPGRLGPLSNDSLGDSG